MLNPQFASAGRDNYNITYYCPYGCIAGKDVNWQINLTNFVATDLRITSLKLVDAYTNKTLSWTWNGSFFLGAGKTKINDTIIVLETGQSATFNLSGILPLPNAKGDILAYRFCYGQRSENYMYDDVGQSYEYCFKQNHTIQMQGCRSNADCAMDSTCMNTSCVVLACAPCQYTSKHECFDYECCADDACALFESCEEHKCLPVSCPAQKAVNETFITLENGSITNYSAIFVNQYLSDHACSEQPCNDTEIISNYTCVPALCADDEFLANYACNKLDCSIYDYPVNHTCVFLNCTKDEAYIDHECVALDCKDEEGYLNNSCSALSCGFLMKAESHECLFNSVLLIEIVLFAVIVALIIVDISRYDGWYRRHVLPLLLRKAKLRKRIFLAKAERAKEIKIEKLVKITKPAAGGTTPSTKSGAQEKSANAAGKNSGATSQSSESKK